MTSMNTLFSPMLSKPSGSLRPCYFFLADSLANMSESKTIFAISFGPATGTQSGNNFFSRNFLEVHTISVSNTL